MPDRFAETNEERKMMDDERIMNSLADILLRADLITPSEKLRIIRLISQECDHDA